VGRPKQVSWSKPCLAVTPTFDGLKKCPGIGMADGTAEAVTTDATGDGGLVFHL